MLSTRPIEKMTIGIPIEKTPWTGGLNYLKSLVLATNSVAEANGARILIVTNLGNSDNLKSSFPNNTILESKWLGKIGPHRILRELHRRLSGNDTVFSQYLRRQGIDVLSHGPPLGLGAAVPSITWIPDFQHIHLPNYFSKDVLDEREKNLRRACRDATRIVLSSESTRRDFSKIAPLSVEKASVLRFVSLPPNQPAQDPNITLDRLGLTGQRFLYMPNQMWIHKNHILVFKAVREISKRIPDILVVTTGEKSDFRSPNHPATLEKYVAENNLKKNIKILGSVNYSEVSTLFWNCHAIINPSQFEGWSTSVEEAKTLGKPLALSNLDVHREQTSGNARFFDCGSVEGCVHAIEAVWKQSSPPPNVDLVTSRYKVSQKEFGSSFLRITSKAIENHGRKI
jgi:glycosyltransferase involved in cell wall biosynthesis